MQVLAVIAFIVAMAIEYMKAGFRARYFFLVLFSLAAAACIYVGMSILLYEGRDIEVVKESPHDVSRINVDRYKECVICLQKSQ